MLQKHTDGNFRSSPVVKTKFSSIIKTWPSVLFKRLLEQYPISWSTWLTRSNVHKGCLLVFLIFPDANLSMNK